MMVSLDQYYSRLVSGPPLKPHDGMNLEVLRLASYVNWPNWAVKRPSALAENGLFYSGEADQVKCFSCNTELGNWSFDDKILEKHRRHESSCRFLSGRDTGNIALAGESLETGESSKTGEWSKTGESSKTGVASKTHCDGPEDSGFASADSPDFLGTRESIMSMHNDIRDVDDLLEELKSLGPAEASGTSDLTSPTAQVVPQQDPGTGKIDEVNLQFVKYENYRLRTFEGRWPADSFVSPADAAKAGFYCLGQGDRVQCAFCKGRLLNWTPTDVPSIEHKNHFPECPFVLNRNVGNVPIDQSAPKVQVPKHLKEKETKKDLSPSERLGIMMDKPKHTSYAIEAARLDSFKTWPKNATIPAAKLASAGFFYVGYADNVKCFFCDGGLRNWDAGDDPWREHARWFSRCGFVKLQMGEDYVSKVLAEVKANKSQAKESKTVQLKAGDTPTPKPKPLPAYDPRELKARMDTAMVRAVIDMGFRVDMVKKVLENRLRTEGDDFASSEELLTALFDEQEAEQMEHDRREISKEAAAAKETAKSGNGRRRKRKKRGKRTEEKAREAESDSDAEETTELEESPTPPPSDVQQDEEVQQLMEHYQRIREERTCKICMDEECTIVFLPCGHLVCCANCAPALRSCPICRTTVKGSVRIYTT